MNMFKYIIDNVKSQADRNLTASEKLSVLHADPTEAGCYFEEVLMTAVYETVEEKTGLFLEPSVQRSTGIVNAYAPDRDEIYECTSSYRFEDETTAAWDIILGLDENKSEEELKQEFVDKEVQIILNLLGIE